MQKIPASEFAKNFGRYRDLAQREVIAVTNHDRVAGYFVSPADYEDFARFKASAPAAYAVEELSQETIRAIAASRVDPQHAALNTLLDD